MEYSPFPPPSRKLDLRIVFEIPLRQFVWWLALVLLISLAGYPGVVCVTPVVWLIALRVGHQVSVRSKSVYPKSRLAEAGLAGGLLGLLQGILFAVIIPFMGPVQSDEWTKGFGLILIMLVAGIWVGAGLSFFTAYLNENRRGGVV